MLSEVSHPFRPLPGARGRVTDAGPEVSLADILECRDGRFSQSASSTQRELSDAGSSQGEL